MLDAPNYTQVPNVIFDYWMAILSPTEFKVLLCLCRKTFGWHKSSDTISKKQLMKFTGLTKNTLQAAISCLEEHGLVQKIQMQTEYGFQPNEYRLNIDKPKSPLDEEKGQNLDGGRSPDDPGVDRRMTQGVGQAVTPQKKDSSKETNKKNTHTQPASPACASELENHGSFVKLRKKDYEDLVSKHTEPQVKEMIEALNDHMASTGTRYKDFAATLRNWFRREKKSLPRCAPRPPFKTDRTARDAEGNPTITGKEGMF